MEGMVRVPQGGLGIRKRGKSSRNRFCSPSSSPMDIRQGSFASSEEEEAALLDKFANVALNSDQGTALSFPLRPYAPDCAFYLRTGACKFGLNCRFNHPMKLPAQVVKDNKYKNGSLENSHQIVCKYYLSAAGCKYGESCRYIHPKGGSELQFNFLGLPIRSGAKECPFYMRNGTCGYGAHCVYHHPDPTSIGGLNPSDSALDDESAGKSRCSLGNHDFGESLPSRFSGTSQLDLTSWPPEASLMSSDKTVSFPSYSSPHQSSFSERNDYLGPSYLYPRSGLSRSTQVPNASMKSLESFEQAKAMQSEEFPERPGQPECDYFMKTGDCKFKFQCRFHHPKGWARKSDCMLNDKGLPLRPGQIICRYYERFGICKFGRSCLFDHPEDHGLLISPTWSNTDDVTGNDADPWRKTDCF